MATPPQPSAASSSQQSKQKEVRDNIALTEAESALLGTLLEASKASGTGTVLRCAGGWVRDKLLGRESLDIDVALDNMMGREFAEVVNAWLKSQGKDTRSAAVIQSNPDQSKHLETARMKINDIWIDLVNLRSETYAADSRIPTIEFGTAEQDALRRDFTINSMFYNVNLGVVEDLTGRGLDDLRAGIIRTPLTPMETFLDDPLRVLRAVRFGTRFGFELEQSLVEAASSEQVCKALGEKVSKERIGTELEGMFNGPAPVASVRLLARLDLFTTVFALPPAQQKLLPPAPVLASACCACMEAAEGLAAELGFELDNKEERRFLLLAALLLPLRRLQVPAAKGKTTPATTLVIRESIKWRAKDADMTVALHEAAQELHAVHQQLAGAPCEGVSDGAAAAGPSGAEGDAAVRIALGTVIRKLKQHWKLGVCLAPLLSMPCSAPLGVEQAGEGGFGAGSCSPEASTGTGPSDGTPGSGAHAHKGHGGAEGQGTGVHEGDEEAGRKVRVEQARVLLAAAAAFGLEECWQWKPLMDGKQVMALLGMSKPGPELGRAVADIAEWQLAHPTGSLEQCQQYIAAKWRK